MRVFLAGATGAIGRVLTPLLLADGHQVIGMTRSESGAAKLHDQGAEAMVCDALDADTLKDVVVASRPDAVVHQLTAIPQRLDPRKIEAQLAPTNRLRRDGTRNLIAAARAAGAERLVAQSVAFVYAPVGGWIKDEEAPLDFDSPFGPVVGAVLSLEEQVVEADGIVLRYGYFYGPGTQFAQDGLYGELIRRRRLPIVGSGEGRWSFIHVADAAAATLAALKRGTAGVYNVVEDDPAKASEWIPMVAEAMGAKAPYHVPEWVGRVFGGRAAVAGMTTQRGASNAKIKRELEWTPARPGLRDELGRDGSAP
jgi:nucleoside-diphosphate-sugar epimerase